MANSCKFCDSTENLIKKYQIPVEMNGNKVLWTVNESTYYKIKDLLNYHGSGKMIMVTNTNETISLSIE